MADEGRISQDVLEVMALYPGVARITQSVIEYLTVVGIKCANPPGGATGAWYSHTFPAGGGTPPYVFSISAGSLPPGLTLNPATGNVAGVPSIGGVYSFTITVTDAGNWAASANCSITISQGTAPNYGAAKQKTCPPQRKDWVDWEAFHRECESKRPPNVEEVRVTSGKLRLN